MITPAPSHLLLSPDEFKLLHGALNRVAELSEADVRNLMPTIKLWPKGSFLLRAGDIAGQAGFIFTGALREYYVLADGTERTRSFSFSGDFTGPLSELLNGKPSPG